MDNNALIYGKSGLKRLVSLEVQDDTATAFIQNEDGTITTSTLPNRYWILASEKIDSSFSELAGGLHYRYGRQYVDKSVWSKDRSAYKNMGYDIFTIWNAEEAHLVKDGRAFFQGMKHQEVSVLSFDIETNGILLNNESQVVLISNTYRDSKGVITRQLFSYDEYDTQGNMIDAWAKWVRGVNPSIILGHNLYGFDLPFLDHCSNKGLKLGRDGSIIKFSNYESEFRKDGSQSISYKKVNCYGRTILDTMFLAIKYDVGRKYESYGLKSIIREEGLEKTGRTFYDASTIRFHYKDAVEMAKIKLYAEEDADDALALYDLMVPSQFYWAQNVPKTFQEVLLGATGSQLNSIMMRSYLQEGHSLPRATESKSFVGAISYGEPGIYKNLVRWDVASLYPSIIIAFDVFDECKDPRGHFLQMVKTFTAERLKNKKLAKETGDRYYDDLQGSQKIAINSSYGFLGATGLAFNCPEAAAFITTKGREILTKAIEWATGKNESEIVCLLNHQSNE